MLQITEDTPPDMLAGAMDLTVHLPTGRSVKMAVERSTPMMDLLVQITTNHHLQLSNYTLQALGMAPSSEHSDNILPYKPNTPIGTLDTQHIKVIPKSRSIPVPKNVPPGHQPFESTFRLKVHLPRNQLYVTRVSRNVLLEDIMNKVCEEKNLDPMKYEFKHPGNLDEVLDPKLTLSDYQITEIYVVLKGTASLNQAFSTSDIMALRKEEERKMMHTKTGGGVFNLIFRRGKSSIGSGSISSDTRSISPTHSDDSRSVTPPAVQQQIITPPIKEPPSERPKPPQRKRRPAPKPPQQSDSNRKNSSEKPPSNISETANEVNELQSRRVENGLTICHSRNSSDSSGYHEASVLSENCNTSLPRRPKSAFVTGGDSEKIMKQKSQSTTNLSKTSSHSKSTTSLAVPGRKKKAAPPPPTVLRSSNSSVNLEPPSPVVASQPPITEKDTHYTTQETVVTPPINPVPLPRSKLKAPPKPRPRTEKVSTPSQIPQTSNKTQNGSGKSSATTTNTTTNDVLHKSEVGNKSVVDNVIETELAEVVQKEVKEDKKNVSADSVSNPATIRNETDTTVTAPTTEPDSGELVKHEIKIDAETKKNFQKLDSLIKSNKEEPGEVNSLKTVSSMPSISQFQKVLHENIFSSPEFLDEKKPPEVVAFIPKVPKESKASSSKFDSFGRRRFQIGTSLIANFDTETNSLHSRNSSDSKTGSPSTRNSADSSLDCFNFVDEFSDIDENVFSGSKSRSSKFESNDVFNQLFGIHNLEDIRIGKNQSISSLRSLRSLPGFLTNSGGMRKWNNSEDLDDISLASLETKNKWVTGDPSDSESILSSNISPTIDSLASINSCQSNSLTTESIKASDKSFGSTDSGIAQESHSEKHLEPELNISITPPPPPLFQEEEAPENIISSPVVTDNKIEESVYQSVATKIEAINTLVAPTKEAAKESIKELSGTKSIKETATESKSKPLEEPASVPITELAKEPTNSQGLNKEIKDPEISEIDWQYQLPSPPKAFRDSTPVSFKDVGSLDSESVTDFKDSVVTSPELFEKLKAIEDCQSDKGTVTSDLTSVVSEEEKPLLNKLSLENLEKRKSLVYNRELATSLKMTDNVNTNNVQVDTFSSSLTQFESTYDELRKSSLPKETHETRYQKTNISTHTLPNFKISTYDCPKQKIKVFEDDTVRSNTDNFLKVNSPVEATSVSSTVSKSYIATSMENVSIRKNSLDNQLRHSSEDRDYHFSKSMKSSTRDFGPMSSVFRSESFSTDNSWSPTKPVSRSKSYLSLNSNKYKQEEVDANCKLNISRSNSFFDVSGLQSLEVMKLIQNKLSSPTSSLENISENETHQKAFVKPEPKPKISPKPSPTEEFQKPYPPEKIYKYQGPPSINMGTWSDRPKVPVSVKEDADYKLSNNVSSKLIVNTTNNNITSNNSVEIKNNTSSTKLNPTPSFNMGTNIRVNGYDHQRETSGVSIKVNGTEPVNSIPSSGNVVIKIGSLNAHSNVKPSDNQRFINHATASGYRKPFSNVNNIKPSQRSHSVEFDTDMSRVPVVRSVELKKPFKEMGNNTSVTHIYQGNNSFQSNTLNRTEPVSELRNKFSNIYKSSEAISGSTYLGHHNKSDLEKEAKPVFRAHSFKPNVAPVVRGFKTTNDNTNLNSRLSWHPTTYNTLPAKSKEVDSSTTNKQVPFSQSNLRRTESNKIIERNMEEKPQNSIEIHNERNGTYNSLPTITKPDIIKPPPLPPQMPKVSLKKPTSKPSEPNLDPRDQLLSAIRNFGGKKGLRAVKA